jgi:signal recognition particle GTPase
MSLTREVDNILNVARIENKSLKFSIESILNEVASIIIQDTKDQIDNIEELQYTKNPEIIFVVGVNKAR